MQTTGRRQPVHVGRRPDDGHAGQLQLPHAQPGPRLRRPAGRADAERRVRRAVLHRPAGRAPSTVRPSPWPTATSWSRRTRRRWAPWRWPAPGTTSSSRDRPAPASRRRSPTWSPTSSRTASACCSSARSAPRSTSSTRGCAPRGWARSARWCTTARRTRRSSCTACATPTSGGWPTTSRWTRSRPRRAALIEATTAALDRGRRLRAGARAGVQDVLDRLIALRGFRWGDDLTPAEQALLPEPADWVPARPLVDALGVRPGPRRGRPGARAHAGPAGRPGDPRRVARRRGRRAARAGGGARSSAVLARARRVVRRRRAHGGRRRRDRADARGPRPAGPARPRLRRSPRAPRRRAGCRTRRRRGARSRRPRTRPTVPRSGWREPLSAPDAAAALEIARRRETSAWKFLDGGWRRVKRLVAAGFDAGDRQVRPTVTQALRAPRRAVRHRGPRRRALAAARPGVGARRPRGAQRPDRRDPAVHGHARGVAHAPRGHRARRRPRPAPGAGRGGADVPVRPRRGCRRPPDDRAARRAARPDRRGRAGARPCGGRAPCATSPRRRPCCAPCGTSTRPRTSWSTPSSRRRCVRPARRSRR